MKKFLLPVFLLGTISMMYIMADTGALLKTPATKCGIINLELANTAFKTSAVINAWAPTASSNRIDAAKFNTYSDFLFLFFYAGLLFLICRAIAKVSSPVLAKAGHIIASATLVAGLADVMENIGMLFSLNDLICPLVSFCTAFFSLIKWTIIAIALLYIIIGLLALAYRKIKN